MPKNLSKLNIVRVGSHITFSSLEKIGIQITESFRDIIKDFELSHFNTPAVESIDAYLLTNVLHDKYKEHILGITDINLKTKDFYSILGGKNKKNDVAVVSTKKLSPLEINSKKDYDLYFARTLKVSLHEIGHNFLLPDHRSYKVANDGLLCPMSRGEVNKFGSKGYVETIIDGRGYNFCDECNEFLNRFRKQEELKIVFS